MIVKVEEKNEKTRQVKIKDKLKKYILRGERNARYHDRILSNKKNLISFPKRTISFSFVWVRTFDWGRTFTRTFVRDFVREEYNDLKFCRRIFHYAAGRSGMCMNFF